MATGPREQKLSPNAQHEVDEAIDFIEEKLKQHAPDERGHVIFSMERLLSSGVVGEVVRAYEKAGWASVEFDVRYHRSNGTPDHRT